MIEPIVYKLQWRWWWDSSEEYLANYVGSSYRNWVQDKTVSTKDGKATVSFKVEYPDWGRYMIRVTDRSGGHATGKSFYVDWPAWVSRPSLSE